MRSLSLCVALVLAGMPAKAAADCTVLVATDAERPASVLTPRGQVEGAAVILEGERVAAVGMPEQMGLSEDGRWQGRSCRKIDTSGTLVTPGLVAVDASTGLVEVSAESGANESSRSDDADRAGLVALDGYNPRSTVIPITRVSGVTSAVVMPRGGRVAGQAGWVDLVGTRRGDAIRRDSIGLVANYEGPSHGETLLRLRETFDAARAYARNPAGFALDGARDGEDSPRDLAAIQPVLRGRVPLVVRVDRASDIERLLGFAREERIRLVIVGGAEAWLVADELAAASVPVVVDPLVYGAGGFEQIHGRADNALLLHRAGVELILSAFDTHNARTLPQIAGNAVRGGLPWDAAMAAVTTAPARVFGTPRDGRIEDGAVANVVVWEAVEHGAVDPLDWNTRPKAVIIHGELVPSETRQSLLRDRYMQLPGTPLAPLEL